MPDRAPASMNAAAVTLTPKSEVAPGPDYISATPNILLDMDGTILDRNFDDFFWEQYLPETYGRKNNLNRAQAKKILLALYREQEGTLQWTDLDYWSTCLGLDIPALKEKVAGKIALLPHAERFLRHCHEIGKTVILVTNAHPKALAIKLDQTGIDRHLDHMICADELGRAKEEIEFWPRLMSIMKISPDDCFLADDNHQVLRAATAAGIRQVVEISRPSSQGEKSPSGTFPWIENFARLMQ